MKLLNRSNALKFSLFATGLSGIVAEYILSTLATYFLGNSVIQWTLILSCMLFSMGLGSRISRYMNEKLLEKFIIIEFILSFLVSFCALITYTTTAFISFRQELLFHHVPYIGVVIYTLSIAIGLLIGMEIPLVTRLNEEFEELKVNISKVMENDYYGSLIGGLFFAFIGLPILGLTYTPFILGLVNLLVAFVLMISLNNILLKSNYLKWLGGMVLIMIFIGAWQAPNIIAFGEQKRYKDQVVLQEQTAYQQLVVTKWKEDFWFYINGNLQFSSFDEHLYHEPLVHPAMHIHPEVTNVLIMGGGDGCAVRELLKHSLIEQITLVDLDPKVTDIAKNNPLFQHVNHNSLNDPRVKVLNEDAFTFIMKTEQYFDLIILDFPDPKSIELGRLYAQEFYEACNKQLRPNGLLITQAGSPYFTTKAFYCIEKTFQAAGFNTLPMHNQVITMGEWGWILGSKQLSGSAMKTLLEKKPLADIPLKWLTQDGLIHISTFGKPLIKFDSSQVKINKIHEPVLHDYYNLGNWDLY